MRKKEWKVKEVNVIERSEILIVDWKLIYEVVGEILCLNVGMVNSGAIEVVPPA